MRKAAVLFIPGLIFESRRLTHQAAGTGKKSPLWVRLRAFPGRCFCARHVTAELVSDVFFITCRQKSFVDPSKLEMRFWHHINAK